MNDLIKTLKTPEGTIIKLTFEEKIFKKRIDQFLIIGMTLNVIAFFYLLVLKSKIIPSTSELQITIQKITSPLPTLEPILTWTIIIILALGVFSLITSLMMVPLESYVLIKRNKILSELVLKEEEILIRKHNGFRYIERYLVKSSHFLGLVLRSEKNRFTSKTMMHCISIVCWSDLSTKRPVEYVLTRFYTDKKMISTAIKQLKQIIFSHYGFSDLLIQKRWKQMPKEYAKKYNVPILD